MRAYLNINVDTSQGTQAVDWIKPECLLDLVHGNSAMRLMAPHPGAELPLKTFSRHKQSIKIWYNQLNRFNLQPNEIKLLEKYLLPSYGLCIDQETIMSMSMDENISGFTVQLANELRKAIGKKKIELMQKSEKEFYKRGEALGTSRNLLDYVWKEAFMLSAGYGFSVIHSTLYSLIAIQQAYLCTKYPDIYWNTARLLVESSSVEFLEEQLTILETDEDDEEADPDEKVKNKSINFFKMASAVGMVKDFGVEIKLPSINLSSFTFKPDVECNTIYFGLKGLSRIGDAVIKEIISKRPYSSLEDFLAKVKVNKIQATMLIKAGAFDEFGNREQLLLQYCQSVADTKSKLNLQNVQRLIDLNLIPADLEFNSNLYKINKHLRKHFKYGDIIVPDANMWQYLDRYDFSEIEQDENGDSFFSEKEWKKYYDAGMIPIKNWIKDNHNEVLELVNQAAIEELTTKYGKGSIAQWEMEALSTYHSYHELSTPPYQKWFDEMKVQTFSSIPEEPIIAEEYDSGAKKFQLYSIAGTSVGRDKASKTVGLITTDGFIKVNIHKERFIKYDRQIKSNGVTEKSWFAKGNNLIFTGYRQGDTFRVKTYKSTPREPIYSILEPGKMTSQRMQEDIMN